jgi:hypothetical protein
MKSIAGLFFALVFVCLSTPHSLAACPNPAIAALVGDYDFTTVVLGATKPSAIGVNGYYRMRIAEDRCALTASIAKLGFGKVRFSKEKIQYGAAKARTPNWLQIYISCGDPGLNDLGADPLERRQVLGWLN